MIDPKELRIGNLLLFEDDGRITYNRVKYVAKDQEGYKGYYVSFGWASCFLETDEQEFEECSVVKPIIITSDILINSGYEYDEITYYKKGFDLAEGFLPTDPPEKISWDFWTHGLSAGITGSIRYVHQLQNLYFAINNEELEIKFH